LVIEEAKGNITSISRGGLVTITLDKAVNVPYNITNLPPEIFDVKFVKKSEEGDEQKFSFNLTSFTPWQIQV